MFGCITNCARFLTAKSVLGSDKCSVDQKSEEFYPKSLIDDVAAVQQLKESWCYRSQTSGLWKNCVAAKISVQPTWIAAAILIEAWLHERGHQLTDFLGGIALKWPFPLEVILVQLYCCKVTVKQVQESAWTRVTPASSFSVASSIELLCDWRWGGEASSIPSHALWLHSGFVPQLWNRCICLVEMRRLFCFLSPLCFLYSPQTVAGVGYILWESQVSSSRKAKPQ